MTELKRSVQPVRRMTDPDLNAESFSDVLRNANGPLCSRCHIPLDIVVWGEASDNRVGCYTPECPLAPDLNADDGGGWTNECELDIDNTLGTLDCGGIEWTVLQRDDGTLAWGVPIHAVAPTVPRR